MTPVLRILMAAALLHGLPALAADRAFDQRTWSVGYDAADATQHITEYVVLPETVESWSELVTRQVVLDPTHALKPAPLAARVRSGFGPDCRGFRWKVLEESESRILYEWSHAGCDNHPPQYEVAELSTCAEGVCRWAYATKRMPASEATRAAWRGIIGKSMQTAALAQAISPAAWQAVLGKASDYSATNPPPASFVFAGPQAEAGTVKFAFVAVVHSLQPDRIEIVDIGTGRTLVDDRAPKLERTPHKHPSDPSVVVTLWNAATAPEPITATQPAWLHDSADTVVELEIRLYRDGQPIFAFRQPATYSAAAKQAILRVASY
jgi:hypothetical protein